MEEFLVTTAHIRLCGFAQRHPVPAEARPYTRGKGGAPGNRWNDPRGRDQRVLHRQGTAGPYAGHRRQRPAVLGTVADGSAPSRRLRSGSGKAPH
ncbi:hypothetical protein GCM10022402_26770 [Salinactinospora qingdaonensis]|uniref:Uncharacterized protein n=1 Tax=Salinactinospora qingdaonensis TaxID=702744 RepID=A0ABP7FQL1_9ACTN